MGNHKLTESPMKKGDYVKYIKGYMKAIKERLAKDNPEELDTFTKNVEKFVKNVVTSYKEWDLYIGESYNPDGMLPLVNWDGETPYVYFFKHGLIEEKV